MDLKSMLNVDASAQRPSRLQSPHSSYDDRNPSNTPREEPYLVRSTSHSSHLSSSETRAHSGGPGYFPAQSPHPPILNAAPAHSVTPGSAPHQSYIAQSPGGHTQQHYAPRDNAVVQNAYNGPFAPSPSMSARQPPTPGSAGQYQHQHQHHTPISAHSQIVLPPSFHSHSHSPSHRNSGIPHNLINPQSRQISPVAQYHQQQPATPLGPPVAYSKVSPSAARPISRGYDQQQYRRGSYGSIGSSQSREYIHTNPPVSETRADSVQRQTSIPEIDRSRERDSVSVSPKTIPKPSPYRQLSSHSMPASQPGSGSDPSPPISSQKQVSAPPVALDNTSEARSTSSSSNPPALLHSTSSQLNNLTGPELATRIQQTQPPAPISPVPARDKIVNTHPNVSLKRTASHLNDPRPNMEQSRKRLRRDDVPIFAQIARRRAVHFGDGSKVVRHKQPAAVVSQETNRPSFSQPGPGDAVQGAQSKAPPNKAMTNGHASHVPTQVPGVNLSDHKWEPTIANETPREDLSFAVANWIFTTIGREEPPIGGALFEVEAKVGEIHDIEEGRRLRLPVSTETLFVKDNWRRTRFESSMNMEQHRQLNQYLNKLTQDAHQENGRAEVRFEHLREYDEFYELNEEGIRNLNPSIKQWLKPRQAPKVRRTIDKVSGQSKATIIKSRIADIEIYNPGFDFDYRISISIESPWAGDPKWLNPMKIGEGATRQKDRMSYRHLTNQIDLTQVAHEDSPKLEHELEVEMSTSQLYTELERLKATGNSRFEDLVRSLLDNTRLLCRQGSIKR